MTTGRSIPTGVVVGGGATVGPTVFVVVTVGVRATGVTVDVRLGEVVAEVVVVGEIVGLGVIPRVGVADAAGGMTTAGAATVRVG